MLVDDYKTKIITYENIKHVTLNGTYSIDRGLLDQHYEYLRTLFHLKETWFQDCMNQPCPVCLRKANTFDDLWYTDNQKIDSIDNFVKWMPLEMVNITFQLSTCKTKCLCSLYDMRMEITTICYEIQSRICKIYYLSSKLCYYPVSWNCSNKQYDKDIYIQYIENKLKQM